MRLGGMWVTLEKTSNVEYIPVNFIHHAIKYAPRKVYALENGFVVKTGYSVHHIPWEYGGAQEYFMGVQETVRVGRAFFSPPGHEPR